ncbi:AB hydrolase superfamily protein [Paramyrothecium foliicola]|nr:AB hydrolase superfamily protein [Paramyrothecium foliicola]
MDLQEKVRMIRLVLPVLPHALGRAILNFLGRTEQSQYMDARTEFIIAIVRGLLQPKHPRSVSEFQPLSVGDKTVRGRVWISTYLAPAPPESSVRDVIIQAIRSLSHSELAESEIRIPQIVPVEAEWTGYRAGVSREAAPPDVPEQEKYKLMMAACTSPTTVLYLHGGAYYLCDPATHRNITSRLSKLTGGRCYSVRYRLAPQNPFPSALLDALVSYLTLLYPPAEAFHEPVKPEHIVLSGDSLLSSAGGNLSLALLQLLLELRRQKTQIMWHGQLRNVPLPGGVAVNSPWLDISESDPVWQESIPTPFDYLPKRGPMLRVAPPPCPVWPAKPPRKHMYADDALVAHPLVSVATAKSWAGSPPIYMCVGWEILAEEDKFLARKLVGDGVTLRYEEYEAMPHVFVSIVPHVASSRRCYEGWAGFISQIVAGDKTLGTSAALIKARTLEEQPLKFEDLIDVTEEAVRQRIIAAARAKAEPDIIMKL